MRYQRIVVGTDGSDHASRARDVALALAKANHSTVTFVLGGAAEDNSGILAEAERAAADRGVKAKTEARDDAPSDAIVEAAEGADADLIVVGSRGLSRSRLTLLGSVSMRVAHHAPCDVLIVRSGSIENYGSVLICTDGSVTADRCAQKGYQVAQKLGARLTMLFVGHPSTGQLVLEDTCRSMTEDGDIPPDAKLVIEAGDPAERILDVAEDNGTDLIVVGNRGMSGTARFLLGSIPQKVALHAQCDVLIARTDVQPLADLKPGEGGIVKVEGRKVAAYRDDSGEIHAVSAKCTHMGCTVGWNPAEKTWDCPCHGSRFNVKGEVVNGPAAQPLRPTIV